MHETPTAERILSLLADLYADQAGIKITYTIEDAERGDCTLDRINVDGNYCPENCRWVDMYVQNNNRRKSKEDEEYGLSIHE
jgi:hypothetical protein